MATGSTPTPVPWPLSTFPGAMPQESAGRLINCYGEPLGDPQSPTGPAPQVWRRSPGLSQLAISGRTGYRGGLIVNNLSFEVYDNVVTVDTNGVVTNLGALPGTRTVSLARNQRSGANSPDVVAVDVDNGAFSLNSGGAPVAYNGAGNLPQPNSVCFQDSYFFFGIADCRVFASGINALTQNSQTFTTANARADVTGQRVIAYNGLLFVFTSGHCEVWQDTAQPFPGFPYSRLVVLDFGLLQGTAIAGWETGFANLLWVAQDFGVYLMPPGQLAPTKVSPPDLDRLIETANRAGVSIEAGCYAFAGRKFWTLSSPTWTWEFNLSTGKWNERWSLSAGAFTRWRFAGGHPAFGKWLGGDRQGGNLLWVDPTNYTENGAPQLWRMESGPVQNFPNRMRVARADFNFDTGTGMVTRAVTMNVTGAAAGTGGVIRLTVDNTAQVSTNDTVQVSNVLGTTEANGTWACTLIDATHIELQGTVFVHAWTLGGTVVDVTAPPNVIDPTAAVSWSDDDGVTWGNPLLRSIGQQAKAKTTRVSVKNTGRTGPQGRRWRIDVTDPVYVGFIGSTQSTNPVEN